MQRTRDLHRDFVANASHELKTPLAAVSGVIETLLGHARDDPEATERFLHLLDKQVQRMTRLIEDLLSLNRIELNERVLPDEPQDLSAIVGETVDVLRPVAEASDVDLQFTGTSSKPIVRADRDELGQVFANLVDNAIKYGAEGGTVRITVTVEDDNGSNIVGVAVRDDGPGIAREHLPRLTERFFRVNAHRSREKGGTGLGLAIVKHIVNRHRGRLQIESEPSEGSCFTVWLPMLETSALPGEGPARERGRDSLEDLGASENISEISAG